ncbi:hypothetical protein BJ138DRAFT_1017120 [Hygrophoropsis aurantiaca]|uniref:Uncharacterized protein n=1 Tax=Hygrophoropsis aurantiaca TaxID=72124 RepID=A0ACB7ZXA6_9AGAM|nr:hypothetical protein BJ138DRAFT_1017120 [Hygrophoropsis aurantiaca]
MPPKLLVLDIYNQPLQISHTIGIKGNKSNVKLHLKGIVYYKNAHFTSVVIKKDGMAHFHDGMQSHLIESQGFALSSSSNTDLSTCRGGKACLVVYSRLL